MNVFEGQYLMTKDGVNGLLIYSPWFPRQGDRIRYTLDLLDRSGSKIQVTLFHKNTEDTGDGSTTSNSIVSTASFGRSVQEYVTGLKELVRYQFKILADADGTLGWVSFRMLPPVWFDAVSTV